MKASRITSIYLKAMREGNMPVLLTNGNTERLWNLGEKCIRNFCCNKHGVSFLYTINGIPYYYNISMNYITGIGIRETSEIYWFDEIHGNYNGIN